MKKYILMAFVVFLAINSYASWTGIENLTEEQKKSKLSACKKLKAENKLLELTTKDWATCNELLSEDLMSSYSEKTDNKKPIAKTQEKPKFTEEEMEIVAVCEASKITKIALNETYLPVCNKAEKFGISAEKNKVQEYIKKMNKWQEEQKSARKRAEFVENIAGFVGFCIGLALFVLFCWFIFFKTIPKLIYVIRKSWLEAGQDAKK